MNTMNYDHAIHVARQLQQRPTTMHVNVIQEQDYLAMRRFFINLHMAPPIVVAQTDQHAAPASPAVMIDGPQHDEQMTPNKRLKMGE